MHGCPGKFKFGVVHGCFAMPSNIQISIVNPPNPTVPMSTQPVQFLGPENDSTCKRCGEEKAVLVSRRDLFCSGCFVWFMRGKQRKLMLHERYKVKYGAVADRLGVQKVLLPVSFGASSLVLLDMVASLLQEQNLAHSGKQGFDLVLLHILEEKGPDREEAELKLLALAQRYSPVAVDVVVIDPDTFLLDKNSLQRIQVGADFHVIHQLHKLSKDVTVQLLLENCVSNSLRADLLQLVYHDIIVQNAVSKGCQTVILGHSMTRLASEVLSLAVKGRGAEIHQAIADRSFPHGDQELHILFPLRDILFAEVQAVLDLTEGLSLFSVQKTVASTLVKNMTVQALSTKYFEDLGANGYASTASTVVKTAEKLGAPKNEVTGKCRVCLADIHTKPKLWLQSITVKAAAPLETDLERDLAQEYDEVIGTNELQGKELDVCYGCTVTLLGAGDKFAWPARASKEEILDEFILDDDE